MSYNFDASNKAFNEYQSVHEEMQKATDPRPLLNKLSDAYSKFTGNLISDVGQAVLIHQQTGHVPDQELKGRLRQWEQTINTLYSADRPIPPELNAGLNKLFGLSAPFCVDNSEQARKMLKDAPVGSFVIWPSKTQPGNFGFLQKLPGDDIMKKQPTSLDGSKLKSALDRNVIHFALRKKFAVAEYNRLVPGQCIVWPSESAEGKFGIVQKTRSDGDFSKEEKKLIDPKKKQIDTEVHRLQRNYYEQMEANKKAEKESQEKADAYYAGRGDQKLRAFIDLAQELEEPPPSSTQGPPSPTERKE